MKKILLILSFLLAQSCGWFETEMKTIDLIGNIKIITAQDDISRGISIASFRDKSKSIKTLFVNCKSVLLDKKNGIIFIESISYNNKLEYNTIVLKDINNLNSFEIKGSSENDYILYSKKCDNCELFDYSK